MSSAFASQSNTYVPEVTDKLIVDFSRNEKDFHVNNYVQIVPVDEETGLYPKMDREEAGRLHSTDGREALWPDGAPSPVQEGALEGHQFKPYFAQRFAEGCVVGDLAVEQAVWDVVAKQMQVAIEKTMRRRTIKIVTQATTSGNYDAAHVSTPTAIAGGKLDVSTTATKYIEKTLQGMGKQIIEASLNGVKLENLVFVINHVDAARIKVSQELIDYIKGSPDALAEIKGELPGRNVMWGLPNKLFGFEIVVEDTVYVTNKKGGTKTVTPILPTGTAFMCSRVGGLVNESGSKATNFSTHVLFMKEEMSTEIFSSFQNIDRRKIARVTDHYDNKVVAPIGGYLLTGLTG